MTLAYNGDGIIVARLSVVWIYSGTDYGFSMPAGVVVSKKKKKNHRCGWTAYYAWWELGMHGCQWPCMNPAHWWHNGKVIKSIEGTLKSTVSCADSEIGGQVISIIAQNKYFCFLLQMIVGCGNGLLGSQPVSTCCSIWRMQLLITDIAFLCCLPQLMFVWTYRILCTSVYFQK